MRKHKLFFLFYLDQTKAKEKFVTLKKWKKETTNCLHLKACQASNGLTSNAPTFEPFL